MILVILVATVLILAVSKLVDNATLNLANVILDKALWQRQTAARRQRMLSWAATLLEVSYGREAVPDVDTHKTQCSMIPALVIADYHRRQGELEKTTVWLHHAIEADPIPVVQDALTLPGWVSIDRKGNIVLDWASSWRFRSDSQTADLAMNGEQDWLTISYENTLGQRDKVIYQWSGPLQIPYWHTLCLRARVHPGTFLTVETHSAAGVERHINYHRGTGEWEEFTIPLAIDSVKWIYVSLREPSPDPDTPAYAVDIEPLTLLLDDVAGECKP